jgi:hypothetical protein
MQHKPSLGLAASALLLAMLSPYPALAEEPMSKEIIAAKVRKQGYVCEAPKNAVPDAEITEPGAKGWMLECENASYKVMLNPHAAARIERVDQRSR